MNILFFLRIEAIPTLAGVERVTHVLSQYFISNGISVSYLYSAIAEITDIESHRNIRVHFLPNLKTTNCSENINFIKNLIKTESVNILINQSAVGNENSKILNQIKLIDNFKIISVLHGTPYSLAQFKIQFIESLSKQDDNFKLKLKRNFTNIFAFLYYKQYCFFIKNSYKNSNVFVLLSKTYFPVYINYIKIIGSKLQAIPNPLSYNINQPTSNKDNIILYVGRLEYSAKRVDRLLYAWNMIYKNYNNWKLVIVGGDGGNPKEIEQRDELVRLTDLSRALNLRNIEFVNRQDPKPYYEKSKIFCMTSSYEGFPMVLGEAMQYGVVPVVFDSFAAIYDIVDNKQNGIIVKSFDIDEYANAIEQLIINEDDLMAMSENAFLKSKDFEIEKIGKKWLDLFDNLLIK